MSFKKVIKAIRETYPKKGSGGKLAPQIYDPSKSKALKKRSGHTNPSGQYVPSWKEVDEKKKVYKERLRTHAKGTKYLPIHPIHRGEKKEE